MAPHEVEKTLHELELLSLQGDSSETQCSPALPTYHHPKDLKMGQQHGDLDGKVLNY